MSFTGKIHDLPQRPVILCTWFDGIKWRTYERISYKTNLEEAFEETKKECVWSEHPTFEMQFVGYA